MVSITGTIWGQNRMLQEIQKLPRVPTHLHITLIELLYQENFLSQ